MIEMNGAVTGLITTQGHRDEIEIRRGYKENIWDPAFPPPPPIARRRHRFGVPERLDFQGNVVTPLDEDAVREALRRLRRQGIESIAVCFLFSFVNPAHERRVREIVARGVSRGAHLALARGDADGARVRAHLDHAGQRLRRPEDRALSRAARARAARGGLRARPADHAVERRHHDRRAARQARRRGARLGPDRRRDRRVRGGGALGRQGLRRGRHGRHELRGVPRARRRSPTIRSFWNWHHRYLVGLPMVDMHSIGAGGGSIAIVEAGALQVGPESARPSRARSATAAAARARRSPTPTSCSATSTPRRSAAASSSSTQAGVREAILEQVGRPLGLDVVEAAHGIFRIVNANMANAIRRVVRRGGPRSARLPHGGVRRQRPGARAATGRGARHRKLLVPKTSPAFSALGLLLADHVVDELRSYIVAVGPRVDRARERALRGDGGGGRSASSRAAGLARGDSSSGASRTSATRARPSTWPVPARGATGA